MSWQALPCGLLANLALAFVVTRSRKYAVLLGDAHHRELAEALPTLRDHLLADPRDGILVTKPGLVLVCSLRDEGDATRHHLSISYPPGVLARSAGLALIAFVLERMGVGADGVDVFETGSGVIHATFPLDGAAQSAWEARDLAQGPDLRESRRRALGIRDVLIRRLRHEPLPS